MTSNNILPKCVLDQSHMYTDLSLYLFRTVLQSYLIGCLLGYSPHLPRMKLNSQLSRAFFFFQSIVLMTMKGPKGNFSPLSKLYKELAYWYQQRPLVPIHLLGNSRQFG